MSDIVVSAVIALGANLDNPQEQIQGALVSLSQVSGVNIERISSLYRTSPVGYLDQPDFVNAVAMVSTTLSAMGLLRVLQGIEHDFGRVRDLVNGPRRLDLDIIDFNQQVFTEDSDLILPHPRAHDRSFVMVPLAEIAPDYVIQPYGTAGSLVRALQLAHPQDQVMLMEDGLSCLNGM